MCMHIRKEEGVIWLYGLKGRLHCFWIVVRQNVIGEELMGMKLLTSLWSGSRGIKWDQE